ncbi:MAG TPA: hypothetical protein VGA84_05080 [Thermoanaerobaculia bacterium]
MRKRSFIAVAALLLLHLASIRADEQPAAKPWDALWRFDTHG